MVERSVEKRASHHILPRRSLAKVFVVLGGVFRVGVWNTICLVSCGALLTLVVLIVETTIHSECSAWLAELCADLQELVEVEGLLLAPVVRVGVCQRLVRRAFQLLSILILANGVTLSLGLWVVALIGEVCTRHQRRITRNLPIETRIETRIEVHCVRYTLLIHITDRHRSLVPLLGARVVVGIGVVEEERTLELHIVAATPLVRVVCSNRVYESDTTLWTYHIGTYATTHTATATTLLSATHAQDILEREVLLVYIVEESD